jgi:Tol biopolymer transport system component
VSFHRIRHVSSVLVYAGLLAVLVLLGCTSKEEPSEVLDLCGNASCGDLTMITSDTTSDGYQYLDVSFSPDGQRILFTGDWGAIPTDLIPDTDLFPRQIMIIPVEPKYEPRLSLPAQGGELVELQIFDVYFGGNITGFPEAPIAQKADPAWLTGDSIVFSMQLARGNRICVADISDLEASVADVLYYHPDDLQLAGRQWQDFGPAPSPDGEWVAFTSFGCFDLQNPSTCTQHSLWVIQMNTVGAPGDAVAYQLTTGVSHLRDPSWSPDGRRIVFSATPDIVGETGGTGWEIFTIDFDPVATAAGEAELNLNLRRITNTVREFGNPLDDIRNYAPIYNHDGSEIYFVSTRRAPSVTLYDRNIWRVVSDGSLEPQILFFSREDDIDPSLDPNSGRIVLSSRMGFPTYILDRIEAERIAELTEAAGDSLTETEIEDIAGAEREELEFFEGVMAHIYVFDGF